jgi:serine/threonine protein kinase
MSARELLEALRDAIRGHKLLLEDGKILHLDISENNIIITEAATQRDPKGMLIDLDLGEELDSRPSGASHRTGTMQFMAIEVLQGKGPTYGHDFESFFYVFIWMCIRYGYEDTGHGVGTAARGEHRKRTRPTTTSVLRDWYTGNYKQIANTKLDHTDKNGFENVIAEFTPQFESLKQFAREL